MIAKAINPAYRLSVDGLQIMLMSSLRYFTPFTFTHMKTPRLDLVMLVIRSEKMNFNPE